MVTHFPSSLLSLGALSALLSSGAAATNTCIGWVDPSDRIAGSWTPGIQGGRKMAFCRVIDPFAVPPVVSIGKLEPPHCYFVATHTGAPAPHVNGTAQQGYQVAIVNPGCAVNPIDTPTRHAAAARSATGNTVVAGFDGAGGLLALCLATDGEGAGSRIPGQLYTTGDRAGQCCFSAGFKEICVRSGYTIVTTNATAPIAPTPPPHSPPPPITPEPVPALLEPKGGIFEARLSFGGGADTMSVTFSTPNTTAASYVPTVVWADARPGSTPRKAKCSSSVPRTCYTKSPVVHTCNLTGLSPGTRYTYQVGDPAVGLTQVKTFTSAPSGPDGNLSIVVYGDMGLDYSKGTRALLARLAQADAFDFVIHNGDVSYADNHIGTRGKPGVPDSIYNDWMDVFYANVSAYGMIKPYMLSPGNHEAPCDYTEYNARAAAMPFRQSKSTDVQYYSYTVGPVHVVALSGEAGRLGKLDALEIQWLEADLAEAAAARERGEIGWIITHVHYPNVPTGYCSSMMSYCCADGRTGLRTELEGSERYAEATSSCVDTFMTDVNKYVEDMFVKYHVDVHLTAHQHVYERTTPVYRYQAFGNGSEAFPAGNDGSKFVNPKYPININNGCPGNVELQDVWMPRPKWSVGGRYNGDGSGGSTPSSYTEFGFVKMAFEGTERATFDYVDSKTGKVLDSFVVER